MLARTKVRIVAGLFAASGLLSVLGMFRPLGGRIQINLSLGLVSIPVAFGLLTLRPFWRRVGLVVLGGSLFLDAVLLAVVVFQAESIRVETVQGLSTTGIRVVAVVFLAASAILALWSITVLRTESVRHLFQESAVQRA
jgi:hypothetical protein